MTSGAHLGGVHAGRAADAAKAAQGPVTPGDENSPARWSGDE